MYHPQQTRSIPVPSSLEPAKLITADEQARLPEPTGVRTKKKSEALGVSLFSA
jgi:hypothetical protein